MEDLTQRYRMHRVLYERHEIGTSIYLCEQLTIRQLVVIKRGVLSRRVSYYYMYDADSKMQLESAPDSFRQELHVACLLLHQTNPHPHVVQFMEAHNTSDDVKASALLVMEFCPNGDLFSLLEQQNDMRFPEQRALQLFTQVVQGVQHLHSIGIAHRDISLENVLIDAQGNAKICDFGLSTTSLLRCTEAVGKLQYMAPEVVYSDMSQAYDAVHADVWSLGTVLFIMLTGSPLFRVAAPSDPAWNAVQKVGIRGVLMHWGLADSVSQSTVALVTEMLSINVATRSQSLRSVMEQLMATA